MYIFLKRIFDIFASGIAILILSPLLIPVIIGLSLTGEGCVFYKQERLGYRNKPFLIWKFATMLKNSSNMSGGYITVKKDPRLARAGVSGFNKPKRTPSHPTKSHVVVAKEGDKVKTIRYGQQGVSGAGKNPKTASEKARRKSFKARHAKNIAKGKMSAAYWANKSKW